MSDKRGRSLRLEDIAARAGVSPITVSRVIRTPEKVAPETRRRVEHAIDVSGYIPNAVAGSLASSRTRLVVAIFPNLRNPLFPETITGLTDVLTGAGYQLVVGSTDRSPEKEEGLLRSFMAHRPCAIFLHRTVHTERTRRMLLASRIPVVEGGDLDSDPIDSVVSYSHRAAGASLTRHLLGNGRRNIAFVGSEVSDRHQAQLDGCRTALADAGLRLEDHRILDVPHSYENGRSAVRTLIDRDPAIDAIVFSSATTAAGAIIECAHSDIPVPGRIAVGSLDDSDLAPHLTPALTAVRVSREEIGRTAGQIIIDRLSGQRQRARVEIDFEIVARGSG